jgi:tRNA threonylcarbamoyladenosine biosynthesis protein TsaB
VIETQAEIITTDSFKDYNETIYFIGDSSTKCRETLTKQNFVFKEEIIFPSSREMAKLSYEKYTNNDFVDVAYFEPLYLKDFIATSAKK